MQWTVSEQDSGRMLREFIRIHVKLSSKMLKFLKYSENGITVNGERCTVRKLLKTGDRVELSISDSQSSEELEAVDLPLEILYEDSDLTVPSKPHGMPTHPSHNHHRDTVANALAYRYQKLGVPFVFRPINRLDKDTSGLLIVARNKLAAGRLTESLQKGDIKKRYLAVLDGEMEETEGIIEKPLHRSAASIIVREVCSLDAPDAEAAKTVYRVLARENGHTLVLASPITGRTHQLRVHFASLGHPIVGDSLYFKESSLIGRQALHAEMLVFPHPTTKNICTVHAKVPEDLEQLIAVCFPTFLKSPPASQFIQTDKGESDVRIQQSSEKN